MADFEPFHSAVNRIPMPRQSAHRLAKKVLSPDLFTDRAAPAHDHLAPDRWSGSIDLELTVRTPLVFGEQSKESGNSYVDLPVDGNGNLVMPPTMVKGMISRAYETLTCSRFRVFGDVQNQGGFRRAADDGSVPLTYRGDAASALRLVPIRIIGEDEHGLVGELFYGDTKESDSYEDKTHVYPKLRPAALQGTPLGLARLVVTQDRLERMAPHGKRITCAMTLCLHGDKKKGARYAYWLVTHIHDENTDQLIEVFRLPKSVTAIDYLKGVTGYVCRTTAPGQKPKDLFPRKHDERVFFDVSPEGTTPVHISPRVCEAYRTVVESYALQRSKDPKNKKQKPNRATNAVQRALQEAREQSGTPGDAVSRVNEAVRTAGSLAVGTLAFAVVDDSSGTPIVTEIVPTMIGRHAYQRSPLELARVQEVDPVSSAEKASAADRMFGYVVQDEAGKNGDVALRGRISIERVDASQTRVVRNRPQLLAPLLAPKPGSARRCLTDSGGKTPMRNGKPLEPLPRSALFAEGQLLGTAAYPVHRKIIDQSGFPAAAVADPLINGKPQKNLETRITARTWLATGSVLTTRLSFTNLSRDELGALVWVLTPENLVPSEERGEPGSGGVGYLRMGLGKPFGLGVVEVRIAPNGLRARTGTDLATGYAELSQCLGESEPNLPPSDFPLPNEAVLLKTPWVQAMQRAAYGYSDGHPVRHMSLEENKANNLTDSRTGKPKPGRGVAPTDLFGSDPPKPIRVKGTR